MKNDLANSTVKQGNHRRACPFAMFVFLFGSALGGLGGMQLFHFCSSHSANTIEAYLAQFKEPTIPLCTEAVATLFAGIAVILGLRFVWSP